MEDELFEKEETTEVTGPAYKSKEWHDFVMSHFEPSELVDGNPKCAGLRRVAELLLGDIIDSRPVNVILNPAENGPGQATVVYNIYFSNWRNTGETRVYGEVAEVWHGNTDEPYSAHPAATASTRAEGRALRKALGVNCLAAEELTTKKDVTAIMQNLVKVEAPAALEIQSGPDGPKITQNQINFLDKKCGELNINATLIIKKVLNKDNLNDVGKKEASDLLNLIVEYQNNSKKCPEDLIGYNKDWRK